MKLCQVTWLPGWTCELSIIYWFLRKHFLSVTQELNLIRKKIFFMKGHREDNPVLSCLMREACLIKPTDVKAFPFLAKDRVWADRKAGRQMTRHCSTSENGKLPGPDSQLNTFDQPEPQRQLLWDNRPSEACRAAALWAQRVSDQQAEHRAAGGAPRWNAAWRRPNGQPHSEAIVPLLPTQHSGTLTDRHLRGPPGAGGMVQMWGECNPAHASDCIHTLIPSLCNETYVEQIWWCRNESLTMRWVSILAFLGSFVSKLMVFFV